MPRALTCFCGQSYKHTKNNVFKIKLFLQLAIYKHRKKNTSKQKLSEQTLRSEISSKCMFSIKLRASVKIESTKNNYTYICIKKCEDLNVSLWPIKYFPQFPVFKIFVFLSAPKVSITFIWTYFLNSPVEWFSSHWCNKSGSISTCYTRSLLHTSHIQHTLSSMVFLLLVHSFAFGVANMKSRFRIRFHSHGRRPLRQRKVKQRCLSSTLPWPPFPPTTPNLYPNIELLMRNIHSVYMDLKHIAATRWINDIELRGRVHICIYMSLFFKFLELQLAWIDFFLKRFLEDSHLGIRQKDTHVSRRIWSRTNFGNRSIKCLCGNVSSVYIFVILVQLLLLLFSSGSYFHHNGQR